MREKILLQRRSYRDVDFFEALLSCYECKGYETDLEEIAYRLYGSNGA